jgi:uncharacterized protein
VGGTPQPRPDWIALVGVVVTIALHFVLQARGPNPYFMAGACSFWAGFVIVRARQQPGILRTWGFRADNLARASILPALLFVVIAAAVAVYALVQGHFRFPPHQLGLFLLYPIWGVIQQFLALGIVVNNADDLPLAAGTFALELLIVPLYRRDRNLWPLGVLHGWVGGLFYLWVLNRDLWVENFG